MTETIEAPREATLRGVQRRLAELLHGGDGTAAVGHASIEASHTTSMEPPRLVAAQVIEGHAMRAHRVRAEPAPDFAAFLDGTQQSHVARYEAGMPIVYGTVAAVVRARRNRRLVTWGRGPLMARSVYAPCAHLPAAAVDAVFALGVRVVDTTLPDDDGEIPPPHPLALLERAVHLVQADRERVERELAEAWCRSEDAPLFVDGSIQGSERVATAPCVAGVVKTHRTLYADGDALRVVLALPDGRWDKMVYGIRDCEEFLRAVC